MRYTVLGKGRWSRTRSNKGRRNFVLTLQTLSSCELTVRAITLHDPSTPFVSLTHWLLDHFLFGKLFAVEVLIMRIFGTILI